MTHLDAVIADIELLNRILTIPAAEYVPAIGDCYPILDRMLAKAKQLRELQSEYICKDQESPPVIWIAPGEPHDAPTNTIDIKDRGYGDEKYIRADIAFKQLREAGGWRPIAEAPKDGTKFCALYWSATPKGRIPLCYTTHWCKIQGAFVCDIKPGAPYGQTVFLAEPDAWQPLPSPPTEGI